MCKVHKNDKKSKMKTGSRGRVLARSAVLCVFWTFYGQAHALQALDDTELSLVSGRDGLSITLNTHDLSADSVRVALDADNANAGYLLVDDVAFTPVASSGALDANPITFSTTLDIGSANGASYLNLGLDLSRTRLSIGDLSVGQGNPQFAPIANSKSLGEFALDASAELNYVSRGLLNAGSTDAQLYGKLDDFNLYYRQIDNANAPYFVGSGGTALWRVHDASIGLKHYQSGNPPTDLFGPGNLPDLAALYGVSDLYAIHTKSDYIDLQFDYMLGYKNPEFVPGSTGTRMTPEDVTGLMRFGWTGTFYQPQLDFSTRLLDGTAGLAMATRFNYLREDGSTSRDLEFYPAAPASSSAFRWVFGSPVQIDGSWPGAPSGDNLYPTLVLTDWRNMYDNAGNVLPYGHDFPYIALGVVNGDTHAGYGDLCWGGRGSSLLGGACGGTPSGALYDYETVGFAVDRPAIGLSIRQGNLLTYSETVNLYDGSDVTQPFNASDPNNRQFDWGLLYTFANVDGDIYLYPGGHPDNDDRGITADILLMSQTLSDGLSGYQDTGEAWQRSSILMIADTDPTVSQGIGMMNISWLLQAEKARILLKPTTGTSREDLYNGGLDITSSNARFNLRATFGGRDLMMKGTNMYKPEAGGQARVLVGGINNWNYEGFLNLRLSPPMPNEHYLGYSLAFRADAGGGTRFSTAEPAQPDISLCFCDVTGDMAFVDGKLEVASSYTPGQDNYPALRMSHRIKVGLTASGTDVTTYRGTGSPANNNASSNKMLESAWGVGGAAGLPGGTLGQPFVINALEFNNQSVGAIAIPSGELYGSLTIRPQTPSR